MTITDLMVLVDRTPASQARVETALTVADHFGAHLTALSLIAEPFMRSMSRFHLPEDLIREHLRHAEAEADEALRQVSAAAAARSVSFERACAVGPLERLPMLLAHHARNADLVIVGEPDFEHSGADEALLVETAFMDTGRPALVLPHAGALRIPPCRVLVAWDGSREAARAVHDALPLIRAADETIVLVADADKLDGRFGSQPGAGLVAHLGRHRVNARVKAVDSGGKGIADVILAQADEERADLIVMGGYGHSRLREMILGGVTRRMLERMTLPVLFAH